MLLTRRQFLTRAAAAGGASLVYEAMTGLGLLAAPTQAPFALTGRVSGVHVLILGAGLAGMTVAYELGKVGYDCRVLEARPRPGGRAFTVRRGTVSEEDGPGQTAAFDDGLYFNAGPMRISHHHRHQRLSVWLGRLTGRACQGSLRLTGGAMPVRVVLCSGRFEWWPGEFMRKSASRRNSPSASLES
jgi:hypothetical protein